MVTIPTPACDVAPVQRRDHCATLYRKNDKADWRGGVDGFNGPFSNLNNLLLICGGGEDRIRDGCLCDRRRLSWLRLGRVVTCTPALPGKPVTLRVMRRAQDFTLLSPFTRHAPYSDSLSAYYSAR